MRAKKAQFTPSTIGFSSYLDLTTEIVESELRKLNPVIAELRLQKQIQYMLHTRGKLLRPTLLLISGECVGGDRKKLSNLALAIELLHTATLVHDDILDQDLFRRDTLAVHEKWSVKEAILVGDALASLALRLCRNYGGEILDVMANTCLQLSDGEYMDVEIMRDIISEEDYFEKIKKKSASLFKAAAKCGALAGEGTVTEVNALTGFGEHFGMAFQIKDDIMDVTSAGNKLAVHINELRATLPLIHMCKCAPNDAEELLKKFDAAQKECFSNVHALHKELKFGLQECEAMEYCTEKTNFHVRAAIAELDSLRGSIFKAYLVEMAESLLDKP